MDFGRGRNKFDFSQWNFLDVGDLRVVVKALQI